MRFDTLDRLGSYALQFGEWSTRRGERGHLRFDFLALFFLALDVHVPADQLAGQANVLAFLADGQRKLRVLDNDFEMPRFRIDDLNARDFSGRKRFLRERYGVFGIRDDVDFFTAQFANDRLHAHALHAHARAYRVHILIAALYRNLGALACFACGRADLHGAVVNFGNFHLEQTLH